MAYIGNKPAELAVDIDNASVTTEKLANDAVTAAKIVDGTIIADDLNNGIITNSKVASNAAIAATKLAVSGGSNITLQSDGTFDLDASVDVSTGYSVGGNVIVDSSRNATFATVGTLAGTAAAPAYTFSTDTNTGMFKRGTDQIGFSAGGTEMLALTSTGIFADKLGNKSTASDLTLDAAGDIILDADGADFRYKDAGIEFLRINNGATGAVLLSPVSNKDIIFKGNDDGSEFVALTLDMSEAGKANFNGDVDLENGALKVGGTTVIDSSQNIGVGVAPDTRWTSTYPHIDLDTGGAVYGTSNGVSLAANLYFDGSNWKNKVGGSGGNLMANYNGGYYFYKTTSQTNADTTVTLSERLRVDDNVDLRNGTALQVGGTTVIDSSRNIKAPYAKLGSASHQTWTDSADDIGGVDIFVGSGSHALTVWDDNVQSRPRFIVERGGNVGINEGNPSHELTVAGNSIITRNFGTALNRTYTGAPSYVANGGDVLTLVNSADAASGSQYASIWVQTPQYTGSSGSTRTIRFGGQSVPRAYSADFFVQTRGSNAQLRTRMTVGEEGVMRDYTGNTSSNYKWWTPTADDYQIREYDFGNRLYIKKDGSSAGYAQVGWLNRYLPAEFDMTFELKGVQTASTYRHFGIVLNGNGVANTSQWDYLVLRQHSSNANLNAIRWDDAGASTNVVESSSIPNFFDGNKRRVRIEKRSSSLRCEVASLGQSPYVWGTYTGLGFTATQGGFTGFTIYENGASDTWVEINNLTITEV